MSPLTGRDLEDAAMHLEAVARHLAPGQMRDTLREQVDKFRAAAAAAPEPVDTTDDWFNAGVREIESEIGRALG